MTLIDFLTTRKRRRFWIGLWLFLLLFYCTTSWIGLIRWHVSNGHTNNGPKRSAFLRVSNSDTYLYSAIANMAPHGAPDNLDAFTGNNSTRASSDDHLTKASQSYQYIVKELGRDDLEIVVTAMDRSRTWPNSFVCCVKFGEDSRNTYTAFENFPDFATNANSYFEFTRPIPWMKYLKEYWFTSPATSLYVITQYSCRIPRRHLASSRMPVYATLAPMPSHLARILPITPLLLQAWPWTWLRTYQGYCPRERTQYLPVEYPVMAPGDLGVCSKISYNSPDAKTILEWMELQRHLGVDRVVVYDMGDNSEELEGVFDHYEKIGFLERVPYSLAGEPTDRSLDEELKHTLQFEMDETLAVLECRQRLSGHGIVLSIDKDEVVIPRQDVPLKIFLKNKLQEFDRAPSVEFWTEFFITDWQSSNPEEDVLFLRYRRTRIPRWERYKYAFKPNRVRATITHIVFAFRWYNEPAKLPKSEVVLHHYRKCPRDTWLMCDVHDLQTFRDDIILRYKDGLLKGITETKRDLAMKRQHHKIQD